MNVNRNNLKVFPPRTELAEILRNTTKKLYKDGTVTNVLDDPGFPFEFPANNLGICTSYVRPTNDPNVTTFGDSSLS